MQELGAQLRERAVLATGLSFTVADALAPDAPLIWVNPAFTATTGYEVDDAIGRNCRFLQGEGTDPAAVAELRSALRDGREVSVTLLNYRKDGTPFWNEVAMSPMRDADGTVTHFVGIQTDVTARVEADRERARALAAEQVARHEAVKAQAQLGLLVDGIGELAVTRHVRETLERLVDVMVPAMADWGFVCTLDPDGSFGEVIARHREGRGDEMRRYAAIVRRGAGSTMLQSSGVQSRPFLVQDYNHPQNQAARVDQDPAVRDMGEQLDAASVAVVPLPGRDRVLGSLALVRTSSSPALTEQDLSVAAELGRRAGLMLDNARLYEAEHRIAVTLQRSLLPELPAIPGITAAARYRASESGADVGGDFYDLLSLPGGAIGLVIGDVVGHDILAAAAMGHLRGLLRACAYDTSGTGQVIDPDQVLTRVDRLVQGLQTNDLLASAAYARLDRLGTRADGWRLSYSTAGHPPLLLRRPDGTVQTLDQADGLLLGVDDLPRQTASVHLPAGSTVLAYTDGLVERRGEDIDTGIARLCGLLAAAPDGVFDLGDHLLHELGEPQDDVALLALRTS